jgi:hypothetical protein
MMAMGAEITEGYVMSEMQEQDNLNRPRYEVGDRVEVLCDHNREDVRVNDWLEVPRRCAF